MAAIADDASAETAAGADGSARTETEERIAREIADWRARYDAPDASAIELLLHAHPADALAFRVVHGDWSTTDLTYGELDRLSRRTARVLADLGVTRGTRVGVMMSRSVEYVGILLGLWRLGAVHIPLFTALAAQAIGMRVNASGAALVVVDAGWRHKLDPSEDLPLAGRAWRILRVEGSEPGAEPVTPTAVWSDDAVLEPLLADAEPWDDQAAIGGDGLLALLYTSGTTGAPKGVPLPMRALTSFRSYMINGLDLRDDDVFWNAADPGWAYGLYFGVLGPLAVGHANLLTHDKFSAHQAWQVLARYRVTNFCGAPTMFRAMRNDPEDGLDIHLRRASSAGEPLTPEVLEWSGDALGSAPHDHYGQTEHGMLIGVPWRDGIRLAPQAGTMGVPFPGWCCEILDQAEDRPARPGEVGRLAFSPAESPVWWFPGYDDAPDRTAERFTADGRWYLTGDLAWRGDDGQLHFVSRDDDLILAAGYRISPLDVESVLAMHPAVREVAVVGRPDELRGEVVAAYIVLAQSFTGDETLVHELQQEVKTRYAAHAYPRIIEFVDELPRTASAKVQRYLLKSR
jgi:acetyl-CoA synthetase